MKRKDLKQYYIDLLRPYTKKKLSSREISEATGLRQKHVQKLLKKYDLPRQKQGDAALRGPKNRFWKKGWTYDKHGYVLLRELRDHPYKTKGGYVREHRLVMENHLGRYLEPHEVVHHKNGIRDDNRIENLELFQSNGQHLKVELTGKTPKWTPEGKAKLLEVVRQKKVSKPLATPEE